MKKLLLALMLSSSFMFASSQVAFIGIFSGENSEDYEVTANNVTKKYSQSDGFGMLRFGAYINDYSRAYLETYTFSTDDDVETQSLNSINYDLVAFGQKALIKPLLGISIVQKKYKVRTNNVDVTADTNSLGFRGGVILNLTENLELEFGGMKSFYLTDTDTSSSGSSDAEQSNSTWYYFGLTLKLESLGKYIQVQ